MTTRSSWVITAAVSRKKSASAIGIGVEHLDPVAERDCGDLLGGRALLQRDQSHAGQRGERREGGERNVAPARTSRCAVPVAQLMPILKPTLPSRRRQAATRAGSAAR